MDEMLNGLDKFGTGLVATAIIFVCFLYYMRQNIISQREHNENQVKALKQVSDSNNNVAEALNLIRDMFIDRTNSIENKQDITLNLLKGHCTDVVRIETTVCKLQESVLKTEERTKQCQDRGKTKGGSIL